VIASDCLRGRAGPKATEFEKLEGAQMNQTDHLDWLLTLELPLATNTVGPELSAHVIPAVLLEPLAKFYGQIPWHVRDGERYITHFAWCEFLAHEQNRFHLFMMEESTELGRIGPSAEDLAKAPMLDNWVAFRYTLSTAQLLGTPIGHPVRSSLFVKTSFLCAIDPGGTWARTISRWYRLGKMLSDVEFYALHGRKTARYLPDIIDIPETIYILRERGSMW
jgi:hypothetical protein